MIRKLVNILAIPVLFVVVFGALFKVEYDGMELTKHEVYKEAIGRPIQYLELPKGQYRVISVINEWTQTAVVEKISEADGLTSQKSRKYFLVTGMLPQMMVKDFVFTSYRIEREVW